ncbi:hypothetical protein [Legionella sp.]|uniref:hypothetical protein n=1 Tax=Legionella sp. TaxID=459 RepID=UPI003CA48DCA
MTQQGDNLRKRGHQHVAEQVNKLAQRLDDQVNLFFNQKNMRGEFLTFKKECLTELTQAKTWAKNHRGYKQVFFDFLQTVTVIGALLGGIQWCIKGRYSLFPVHTRTLKLINENCQTLTKMQIS